MKTTKKIVSETTVKELNAAEKIALKIAISDKIEKDCKQSLKAGEYAVDFSVRILGTLNRAENHEAIVTQAAKPWLLLAAAINRLNGVSIDALIADSENLSETEETELKDRTETALAKIKDNSRKIVSGRTTGKVVYEIL